MIHSHHTAALALFTAPLVATLAASGAQAQSWSSSHPEMPSWSIEYTAAVAKEGGENQAFVFGGLSGLSALDDVWRFHRVYGWSVLGNMPGQRAGADAATVEIGGIDRVYLFGGRYGLTGATTTCWAYDPASDTWDSTGPAPMPTARRGHEAVTAPNGKIYVFGGRNASGSTTYTTLEIYDPVANTWSTGPSMPRARYDFAAMTDCHGYIYLYGGEDGVSPTGAVDCFNTATDTWVAGNPHGGVIPNMPTPRSSLAGALGRDGRHYLMGGNVYGPVPVTTVEAFDPYSNTWSFEPGLLQSRNNFEAVGMGSRIYVMGGYRKIYSTTKKVESFGGLPAYGPCGGVVPPLPPLILSAAASSATPMFSTGGIIDHVALPGMSSWVEIALPPGGQGVIDPQPVDETQRFHTFVYDALGNLVAESIDNSALPLFDPAGQGGSQGSRFYVELRNPTSQDIDFSLFSSDSIDMQPIGETYCGPAQPNSTGLPSGIEATGFTLGALNQVQLSVSGLPQQTYGYFLVSQTQGQIVHPGGSAGVLCLVGSIGRFAGNVLNSGANGTVSLGVDLMNLPGTPPASAQPGDTWNFTYWHRDAGAAGATSNFSDAVSLTFL